MLISAGNECQPPLVPGPAGCLQEAVAGLPASAPCGILGERPLPGLGAVTTGRSLCAGTLGCVSGHSAGMGGVLSVSPGQQSQLLPFLSC